MRVTVTQSAETLLDFDSTHKNVLAPTIISERTDAFRALIGALAVVAELEVELAPWEPGSINASQPTDNIAATEGTVPP